MGKLLKDSLILRSLAEGFVSDKENFAEFLHMGHEEESDWRETGMTAWVNDLLNTHPQMSLDCVLVVVDATKNDKIVSGLLLIPQTWRYEDIEIPIGRPELIATLPDYRRRGLVRELMKACHEHSQQQGHLVQAITGIPHYYRQFGYTMAVDLGRRIRMPLISVPDLPENEALRYTLREATHEDIPALIAIDAYDSNSALLSVIRDENMWRYEIDGRVSRSDMELDIFVLADNDNEVIGYLSVLPIQEDSTHFGIHRYVIGEKANYLETFDAVLSSLKTYALSQNEKIAVFDFPDSSHPSLITLLRFTYGADVNDRMYSWYLRILDHVAFIKKITPVLERRLKGSGAQGYTGYLSIGFYDFNHLTIKFEQGKIISVQYGKIPDGVNESARFPFNIWLNIVFGHHSHDDLHTVLPDVYVMRDAAALIDILFPKRRSSIYAIG